jgi:thymidylate synthase (FAD)
MKRVQPEVFLVARPELDYDQLAAYLSEVGGEKWLEKLDRGDLDNDALNLAEFAGRLCYDPATEVLTEGGWKRFEALDQDLDHVLTWNRAKDRAEFQPFSLVRYDYEGAVLQIRQRGLDLLVTPEHRMWVQKMESRGTWGSWHFATAETVGNRGIWRFRRDSTPVSGSITDDECVISARSYRSGRHDRGYGTRVQMTRELHLPVLPYARLLGYVIAEGYAHFPKNSAGAYVAITQSKGPVLDDIRATVESLGLSCQEYSDPRKPQVVTLRVCAGGDFARRIQADAGSGARNKRIPRWLMEHRDRRVLETLWAAMWAGDGSMAKDSMTYTTASEGLAGDVQELLLRLGRAASVSCHSQGEHPLYLVRVLQSGTIGSRPSARIWKPYQGPVWCVSTANGIIYVRRNGHGVWCGNCYRSWEPGLNPNVTRVRVDQDKYLENILASAHGSVLEHVSFSFVLHNVSRVLTHELVRHRPGTAVSQESLRFVRLADIPFWFPEWAQADAELMKRATALLEQMEEFQRWMAAHFRLDDEGVRFHEKKHKTSFMRRFAPDGVATGLLWTANIRTLRHTIEARTDPGAEEEIRLVFGKIGELMRSEAPALFADYSIEDGAWIPRWRKV